MSKQAINGLFNIDKPIGWTSHDVVAAVRRITGEKRVGHAGTLDPLAGGVLVVCVGQATRLAEYVSGKSKTYWAEIVLGVETETYDAEGPIVSTGHARHVGRDDVDRVLASFVGRIEQRPPIYSAIKRDGTPLYRLARRGADVEAPVRQVDIHGIEICDWRPPVVRVAIDCGPGTYIRSIAHDLGQKLGCGAYLQSLVRVRSGRFTLADAVTIDELRDAFCLDYWESLIYPLDAPLTDWPAVILSPADEKRVRSGAAIKPTRRPDTGPGVRDARAYSPDGVLVALLRTDTEGLHKPVKVFDLPEHKCRDD